MSLVYFVIHSFSNLAHKSTCDPRLQKLNGIVLFTSHIFRLTQCSIYVNQSSSLSSQIVTNGPNKMATCQLFPTPLFSVSSPRWFRQSFLHQQRRGLSYPHTKKQRSKFSDLYRIQSVLANLKFSCIAPFITLISTSLGCVFHVKIQHINQTCYNLKCFKRV